MTVSGYVTVAIVLGITAFIIGKGIYNSCNHTYWVDGSHPDPNAKIVHVGSEVANYGKYNKRYKTTVSFSDGFRFFTYATNREQHFASYKIFIDESLMQQIRHNAIAAHEKAMKKPPKKFSPASPKGEPTLNAGDWQCPCGKINAKYMTSCTCGITKKEAITKSNHQS